MTKYKEEEFVTPSSVNSLQRVQLFSFLSLKTMHSLVYVIQYKPSVIIQV
jgi:hypothetical protein